jgi:hypothetical protein
MTKITKEIDERCAPSKRLIKGSCFSDDALRKIATKYNEKYNDKINTNLPREKIIDVLEDKLKNYCDNQTCWLRLNIVKELNNNDIQENTFRPIGPDDRYEWLSTNHIDDVMEQYQKVNPKFIFLGTVPYDFEELRPLGIHNLDFTDLESKGKTELGMIINLDEHWQSGSHWVGLYINLDKNQIYYYDSVGSKPGKRVKKFITKATKYLYFKKYKKELKIRDVVKKLKNQSKYKNNEYINNIVKGGFDIRYNKVKHQLDNSECGVYSIYFIERLITGDTFDNISNNIIRDDEINKRREIYFRNVKL